MTAAQFAEFWSAQGHRVLRTASCYWYAAQPFVWLHIPYHRIVQPSRGEEAWLFVKGPAAVVRFLAPGSRGEPSGGLFVCADRNYGFASLEHKARNQTRRGLERCRVERIDFGFLGRAGAELNAQTFVRQGRSQQSMSETRWQRYCEAARQVPGFEAWGAFCDGQLAAFAVAALVEDHYTVLWQSSATRFLSFYPNNALILTITKQALARPDVKCVNYGLKSVDNTPGLDRFKLSMGFTLVPADDRVVLNPLVRVPLRLGGAKLLQWIARRRPESDGWRKAARVLANDAAGRA